MRPVRPFFFFFLSLPPPPVTLGGVVLGPYHHLDGLEGLPVVGGVVLRGHVVPRSPEDAVPDALVPLVVVLAVEVGRHAGVEPPARAVVGAAVPGGVHVVVAVGRGEELLVMVEVLVEADGISGRPTVATHQFLLRGVTPPSHYCTLPTPATHWGPPSPSPVSADRHPVVKELVGHVKLLVLGVLAHALEVLQLDAQDHVFGFGEKVDVVVAQPELTSAAEERANRQTEMDCRQFVRLHAR